MYTGPHIIKDGLVFGYDNGYNISGEQIASGRFFKGPAHTNLVEEIDPSYGTVSGTNFFFDGSATEEVDIPQVGKRNVQYVEYFNNRYAADGSVNSGTTCCPNLFHYMADGAPYIPVDSSSSYTYSIIYKHTGGYHHPNFMYHYQKTSSNTTLTEGGVSSTSSDRRTHLGNGWYHAWGNIATQSTCTNVLLYSFLYNYGTVKHKYYVAAVSFVKNTTGETYLKIPPQLMLEPLGSVSNTASLIDLKETIDIDVSNVSFDSTGQPIFDGTDDRIVSDAILVEGSQTFETVFMATENPDSPAGILTNHQYSSPEANFGINYVSGNKLGASIGYTDGTREYSSKNTTYVVQQDVAVHAVLAYDEANNRIKWYINGELDSTHNLSKTPNFESIPVCSGRWTAAYGGYYFDGPVYLGKIYNRELSATEIKQNFNAYKNRFSI